MRKNEIVILALKLLGIYIFVQGIASFGTSMGINGISGFDNWSLYFGTLIFLISGLILIFKAENISKYMFHLGDDTVAKFDMSESFQKGALRIIGIYVAIFALPALIHIIGQIIQYELLSSKIPDHLKEKPNYVVPLISQIVRFLLGVFLALGPTAVIKALSRFDKTIERIGT
jgi:hypothetical protein